MTGEDARAIGWRLAAALAAALAVCLGAYLLIAALKPSDGLVGLTFLLVLPVAVGALVAYLADPLGTRPRRFYLTVPLWLLLVVTVAGAVVLREGVVCIVMLAPLWLVGALGGSMLVYLLRTRLERNGPNTLAILALPLVAMQAEAMVPPPAAVATVSRSAVVAASPARLWPLLRGIADVRPGEGRWTVSQDVIGLPRPRGARLVGEGVGAVRLAAWDHGIRFRERITDWAPGRRIGWRFVFDSRENWGFADRHLVPDSAYFRVLDGGYRLEPLGPGRTRVTLHTRYWMRTPVNGYAAWWGELVLGDLSANLLALVRERAEAQPFSARRITPS